MIAVGAEAPPIAGQPVFGLPWSLERTAKRGSVVLGFFGALSNSGTLQNLERLTSIWSRVDAEQGGLLVLTRSPLESARDFVSRHHVLFPMIVDATGEHYRGYGVGAAAGLGGALVRARPQLVRRALGVLRHGAPLPEAAEDQLPGAFVVGNDGLIRFAWVGSTVDAKVDAEALWSAAAR